MKNNIYVFVVFLLVLVGCKKTQTASSISVTWNDTLVAYAPVPITKTTNNFRVFAHILPWFETNLTNNFNGGSAWGVHWTGGTNSSNQQPYFNAPSQIASYYYPVINPYASGDSIVIDYQLLLMKLSGIDGIFIDWPGLQNYSDFSMNVANSNAIISRVGKAGLKYAIVYEDNNLQYVSPQTDQAQIIQAQKDMAYIQTNYFSDPNYEKIGNTPLLLDFGPQAFNTPTDWTTAFSVFTTKPAFFTLEHHSTYAGSNVTGEFGWVEQDTLTELRAFYNYNYSGTKMSAAYAGYNSIYAKEGITDPQVTWVTNPVLSTFQQSIALDLQQTNNNYIQLVTWNDYGEGTMIEPTTQFQYEFLTDLQQQLGVQSSLGLSDLQAVNNLYNARYANSYTNYNPANLTELQQIFYDIASLKMDSAKALLAGF